MFTFRSESSSSVQRNYLVLGAISVFAIVLGVGIPAYLSVVGSSIAALSALPLALFLGILFFAERKTFFFLILSVRSACDIVFESARSSFASGGPGIGGLVNAAIIGLMILIFSKEDLVRKKPLLMAWAWFFCTTCYGLLLSPSKPEGVRFVLAWVSNFAVFYCASYFVISVNDFKNVLRVIVASSIVPVAYGLYALASGVPPVVAGRVQSTFTHPNIFAFYLVLVICIVFYQLKSSLFVAKAWKKAMLFIWMTALFGMLLSTQTRSAWLVCILMFLFFGLLFERRYLIYIFALCCLALLIEPIRDRIIDLSAPTVTTSQTQLDSFRWRVELWIAGLSWMEVKHYLLGYGIGGFSENSPIFFERSDGIHWDAHNVYVQWFFDVGLIGLAGYAWLHCRLLYLLRQLSRIDRVLSFIVILTVVSYLTVSFSDNMMFYLAFNWYYWFFLGAASSLLTVANIDAQRTSIPNGADSKIVVCR
jgi:O-antigen ligase